MGIRATASSLASTRLSMRSIGLVSTATGAVDATNLSPRSCSIASIGAVSISTGRSPKLRSIASIGAVSTIGLLPWSIRDARSCNAPVNAWTSSGENACPSNFALILANVASSFSASGRKSVVLSIAARKPSISTGQILERLRVEFRGGRRPSEGLVQARRHVLQRGRQDFRIRAPRRRTVELGIDVAEGRFQLCGVRPEVRLPFHRRAHALDSARQFLYGPGIED